MEKRDIDQVIKSTVTFLKKGSPGKNGIVRKLYFWEEKKWFEFYKPDDYGDYMPFLSVAEGNTDFAKQQLDLWKKRMIEGIPVPRHIIPLPPVLESLFVDDFLEGLLVIYIFFKDTVFLEEGNKLSKNLIDKLMMKSNMFSAATIPFIHIRLPEGFTPIRRNLKKFYYANSSSNGVFCEKIIDFGKITKNVEYIRKCRDCLDAWLSTKTYKSKGLFPNGTGPRDFGKICIPKHNTNLAYGLLKSATLGSKKHETRLLKLIEHIYTSSFVDGGLPDLYSEKIPSLISTNAYCRLLIETSIYLDKKEYWEKAERIVLKIAEEGFLNKSDTYWKNQMYEDDGEGDFANLIMVLDKGRQHKKLLGIIYQDMLKKYYLGNGLWKDYSLESMQKTTHTKYIGGVLKYLVLYNAYQNGEDLLSEKWLHISQDR